MKATSKGEKKKHKEQGGKKEKRRNNEGIKTTDQFARP